MIPRPIMQAISLTDVKKQIATLQSAERFFESFLVFALLDLGIFRRLAGGPRTFDELNRAIGGHAEALRGILDASVALKILSKQGDAYTASEALIDCLGRPESPAYLGEWVTFLHSIVGRLASMHEVAKGKLPPPRDYADDVRMTLAMDAYARSRGIEMAEHVDFSDARTLLDLGCGPGTYALAVAAKYPHLHATLLDLPGPISVARDIVKERGMSDRVDFIEADGLTFESKGTFDVVLISNVLHGLGIKASIELLKRVYDIVTPGGRLIVQAQYLNDDRTSPRWPTLLNLVQLVRGTDSRNHAIGETTEWMRQTGFTDIKHTRFSLWNVNSCLIGRRPKT